MRNSPLYIIIVVLLSVAACNKDYDCRCVVENPETGEDEVIDVRLEGYSMAGAEDACNNRERYTVDTVDIECNLL